MSKQYSVDDILAEVSAKKAKSEPQPAVVSPARPASPPPFSLSGMEEALPNPQAAVSPKAEQPTRMDLPLSGKPPVGDRGATRVIPALSHQEDNLLAQRQKKIEEFMQRSSIEREEEPVIPPKSISFDKKGKKAAPPSKGKRSEPKQRAKPKGLEEGEYSSPEDADTVLRELDAISRSLTTRMIINALCFAGLLYFSLCNLFALPMPTVAAPETNMQLYLMVNLVLLLLSTLFSATVLGGGLTALLHLQADHDSPAAMAVLAVVTHAVACVVNPDFVKVGQAHLYFAVAALILLMNAVGKILVITRIRQNFELLQNGSSFYGQYVLEDHRLSDELCAGQGLEQPCVGYSRPVGFASRFVELSYTDDYSESINKIISPLFLLFGLGLSALSALAFGQSGMQALTVFTVVLCMASPLTVTFVGALPLLRASNVLTQEGAMISGYEAVDEYDKINALVLDALELYRSENVTLHGIKTFERGRVDEAIVSAASMMIAADGLLKDVFLGVIGGDRSLLQPVENLTLQEGGMTARVAGEEILIGSRTLMEAFGVSAPSIDYERKFVTKGRDTLYLATQGEITAMFVVSYQPSAQARSYINRIAGNEPSLLVRSTDPNITAERISKDFEYPVDYIRILPADTLARLSKYTGTTARGDAYVLSAQKNSGLRLLSAIYSVKQSINWGTVVQLSGLIIGYALTAFLAFTSSIGKMGFVQLMLYQVIWSLAVLILANAKKI